MSQGSEGTGRASGEGGGAGPWCLVTGATGYIGGRLVPELLDAGHRVRCLARSPHKLRDHPWAGRAEVVRGDVTDADSVARAMVGRRRCKLMMSPKGLKKKAKGKAQRRP